MAMFAFGVAVHQRAICRGSVLASFSQFLNIGLFVPGWV
jgi:hypothetical protein